MKAIRTIGLLVVIAAAFAGGYVYKAVKGGAVASADKGGRKILYWVDPMHPAYKSDKPGVAPDCGMKLEPVYADGGAASRPPAEGADVSTMEVGTVQITPEKQQLIGVKYEQVETGGGSRTIRAVGKVAIDETRIGHVHTKVEGWIDKVFVDFTGKLVEKGQPLLTIYSPDMLASQRELLLAAKAKTVMQNSALPSSFDQSESLLLATRRRLELWDLSEAQIDQVLKTGEPIKNITLYSPMTGYITDRKAFPQLKIMPDTDLYTIVDLSHVWIMADVFEYESPNIRVGQTARVSLESLPGRSFNARIDFLQPQVDPMTRTLKVRLNMDNPGLMLKPDMYADVEFTVYIPSKLTVPADAVLNAGERKTVFIDRGDGYFEPRQVKTGEREGDRIQILSGLNGGERVVTSGNFLIDSESQMKAAASGMGGMAGMPGMTNEPAKPETPAKPPKAPSGKPDAKGMGDMPGMGVKKQ
ncbi:MAG: efflux RND transporter periplasmic adaptor subunit [Acidobacteriia bacterium]|nr:efflux RND transporter periplasmic adaptor subunit [Terriglobia bacterium]